MAISSIHFASGNLGYFAHNSRESHTNNAIFSDEQNYCSATKSEAFEVFKQELSIRSNAYFERTGQQLQKNMQTHISAIFNFNKDTTVEQAHKVCEYLERVLDTKVVQMSMHRDEGHIIEADNEDIHNAIKVDTKIKNYHGHIEMLGLDSKGYSIRKKLDKPMLREIQTEVAKILQMERGRVTSYSKEEYLQITSQLKAKEYYTDKKEYNKAFNEKAKELGLFKERKAKRLDTYEYKEMAKQRAEAVKELQKELANAKSQIQELKNENKNLKTQNTKLKNANETLKFDKKELEEQLKKLNAELREKLKEIGAVRGDYAQLEALNKELKEDLKNKVLSHDKLLKSFNDLEKTLIKKDEEILIKKDENKVQNLQILQLQKENEHQKSLIELKEVEILELQNKLSLAQKKSQSYFGLNQELKNEIIALKEQISGLEAQNDTLTDKVIDLEEKIDLKANMDDLSSTKQIKKEDYLSQIVNQYDSTGTGKKESDSSHIKKPNFERLKEIQKKNSLSSKLQEVDNKLEQETQKKRSFRER